MSIFNIVLRPFFSLSVFKGLLIVSICIDAGEVNLTVSVMSLGAWFFIPYNFFKVAGVAVTSFSQPYCRMGCICALYVAFSMDRELPYMLPANVR